MPAWLNIRVNTRILRDISAGIAKPAGGLPILANPPRNSDDFRKLIAI